MFFLPKNEDELKDAIGSGQIEESHYLDFKAKLDQGKNGNKSLAGDIASFAIDGGVMILGVSEVGPGFKAAPINIDGLSEKIENVAFTLIQPPVFVSTYVIPSEGTQNQGFVVIHILASSNAPHMVNGRYMARNDKTQRSLSHSEVLLMHEYRARLNEGAKREILKQISRDPVPADVRRYPHLHLTATPRMVSKPLFRDVLRRDERFGEVKKWLETSASKLPKSRTASRDTFLNTVISEARRHDGVALYSGNILRNRQFSDPNATRAENIVELEISEEGQLRYFNGQVGMDMTRDEPNETPSIAPSWIVEQTREFVELVSIASSQVEYGGYWDISVAITGISGMPVMRGNHREFDDFKYEAKADDYISQASGELLQLETRAGSITEDLLGRFIRSIDMEVHFQAYLDKP